MRISYKFADGTKKDVAMEDEYGTFIVDSRKEEHADNERERYHAAFSIDDPDSYESQRFSDNSSNPEEIYLRQCESNNLSRGLMALTETQRRRLLKLASGKSIAVIAREEGTAYNTVKESINQARKIMKKFY
jgi:DNA-binding CsgD family transcriptional regulator